MFSEYASRFLAQSQSRISNFVQPDSNDAPRLADQRYRRPHLRDRARQPHNKAASTNPYQQSISGLPAFPTFPFASRLSSAPDAPLFHSALGGFRDEDDLEEHEREVADFRALQSSRRVFGASRLDDSVGTDEASNASFEDDRDVGDRAYQERERGRGIKSSWNGERFTVDPQPHGQDTIGEEPEDVGHDAEYRSSDTSSGGKGKMVDVGLESTMAGQEAPAHLLVDMPDEHDPPGLYDFHTGPIRLLADHMPEQTDLETANDDDRSVSIETVPPHVPVIVREPPKHDLFAGSLYLICLGSLFATFVLIYLHTASPAGNGRLGDTVYTTLRSSFHLLAVDTVIAIIVSLLWLALLRSFVRPLVYLLLLAVPTILFSFSLYPLISSYQGADNGNGLQDKLMRWLSFVPAIGACVWIYTAYMGRNAFSRAVGILEFASKILAANPALLFAGFVTLVSVVAWTWLWLGMFTRVFLGGRLQNSLFIINPTTWWLGVFFSLMYLWTLSMITGVQRATTAATVSQWYFHRNAEPNVTSTIIVRAAFMHAVTTIFGTISLATLLALLIRLPLLILPRRLVGIISIFVYSFIPTPVATLLNPLTLTFAAIRSMALQPSARALSQMTFLGPEVPTTTLTPRSLSSKSTRVPLLPYRLAKLLLHATRIMMAMALGFGGWVATARQLSVTMPEGSGIRGSAYAYIVGIVASFIGWGVLGAIEGIMSGIVDASVICWGIERSTVGGASYCLEAGFLFGDGRQPIL